MDLLQPLFLAGVISGLLQLVGYILYLRNDEIDPNPVTWFMFAYGTVILVVLEWDGEATLAELILPIVCGALGVVVSVRCWLHARAKNPKLWWPSDWWPEDKFEKLSFQSDIFITIGYICAWLFLLISWVTPEQKEWAALVFLFLSNLSTFSAFYPIFSTTYKNPEREDWLPWMIWSAAYVILAMITFLTHDKLWHSLMFYPVSNALLHALVGIIVIVRAPLEDMQTSGSKSVISPPSVVA